MALAGSTKDTAAAAVITELANIAPEKLTNDSIVKARAVELSKNLALMLEDPIDRVVDYIFKVSSLLD
jgi:hypothetical protein